MAYIGKPPVNGFFTKQTITGDNSTTSFALTVSVADPSSLIVSSGGVLQEPGAAYSLSGGGSSIVFSEAPSSTDTTYVQFLGTEVVMNNFDTNGAELILDVNGNTSLHADTDDEIDIKVGGTDRSTIKATGFHNVDSVKFVAGTGDDMQMYHDGTNSYLTNATGALKIATETSGIALTIGHTTSEVTIGDNLTVTGNLTIGGTTSFGDFDITNVGSLALDTITNDGTDITLDSSGDIILDAGGNTVFLKDSGTTFGSLDNSSGELVIKSGSSPTTALTFAGANATLAGTLGVGAVTSTGIVTGTGFTAGNAVLAEAELELLDGLTAGTAIASKVVTTDSNIDTTGQRNLTITGELDAATLDISGNADIDGTTNLDAVDIDGAVQIDATVSVGVDDQGYDVKFFGDAASAYMLWDTSADDLILAGNAGLIVPESQFTLGSTAVTSTAAELNLLDGVSGLVQADLTKLAAVDATAAEINLIDGGTARGTDAVASGDGLLINDAGTMKMTNVDTVSTYFSSHNVGGGNIVTTGALASGSIAAGFGAIDNGTSGIRTNTVTVETSLVPDANDGADIGTTSLGFNDMFLADSGNLYLGNDQDMFVRHDGGNGFVNNGTGQLDLRASTVRIRSSALDENMLICNQNGSVDLYYDNAVACKTSSTGMLWLDQKKASFGTSNDLEIYHDGGNSFINNGTGHLTIDAQGGDKDIIFKGTDSSSDITALTLDMSAAGAATFNNDVTAFSDARLKENVETIDNALDKVCAMRGVTFNRIDNEDGGRQTGVIAQEIQDILPEVVKTNDDENQTLSVSYGNMVGVLIEAIKDLKEEIDILKGN